LDFSKVYCAGYYGEKAKLLEAKGQLAESEALLQAALAKLPPASASATNLMQQLVHLLKRTAGRTADALSWMEKMLLLSNQRHGMEHVYSRYCCEQLGFSYAKLGRYDDAIHLFKEMVEKLALIQGGDFGERNAYAAKVRGWILYYRSRRCEQAQGSWAESI